MFPYLAYLATIELLDLFNFIHFIPDVLLNGKQVHELSTICHASKVRDRAKAVVFKLKNELPRQQFAIAIQVSAERSDTFYLHRFNLTDRKSMRASFVEWQHGC